MLAQTLRTALLVVATGSTPLAFGQVHLIDVTGTRDVARDVHARPIGDLDGDGIEDALIWSPEPVPFATPPTPQPAFARAVSGADGSQLHDFAPAEGVISADDLEDNDGDGVPDVIVGSPQNGPASGVPSVSIYSGASGALLRSIPNPGGQFGWSVLGLPDVDGDGVGDYAVGSRSTTSFGGDIDVFSGADDTLLHRVDVSVIGIARFRFGSRIHSAPDLDGDGLADLAATYNDGAAAYVAAFSSATGAFLWRAIVWHSQSARSVASIEDLDGDGVGDLVTVRRGNCQTSSVTPRIEILSGATGSLVRSFDLGWLALCDEFTVSDAPDLDGDGHDDLAYSSVPDQVYPGFVGRVSFVSSVTGIQLGTASAPWIGVMGASLRRVPDRNGDGLDDIIAGGGIELPSGEWRGRTSWVSAKGTIPLDVYGDPVANSTGFGALVAAHGSRAVISNRVTLTAHRLPAAAFGIFVVGDAQANVPNAGGVGTLLIGGHLGRFRAASQIFIAQADGTARLTIDLDALPGPSSFYAVAPGDLRYFQAWFRDTAGGTGTSNFTNAIRIAFE